MKFLQRFYHHLQYKSQSTHIYIVLSHLQGQYTCFDTNTVHTRWKPESISCDRHKEIPIAMLVVTYVLYWHTLAQRTVNLTVRSRKSIIL